MRMHSIKHKPYCHKKNSTKRDAQQYGMVNEYHLKPQTEIPHNSNMVGTSLGKAAFSCVLVISPTIWPSASTDDVRICNVKKMSHIIITDDI